MAHEEAATGSWGESPSEGGERGSGNGKALAYKPPLRRSGELYRSKYPVIGHLGGKNPGEREFIKRVERAEKELSLSRSNARATRLEGAKKEEESQLRMVSTKEGGRRKEGKGGRGYKKD